MMAHLQQVLSAEEVRRLQDCAARARWQDGRATAGDLLARQKNNEQVDVNSAEGEVVAQVVREGLERHPVFTAAALPARITPPMLNRYVIGMEYGAHVDASIMGGAQPLRADLSATLFLSEPDDYDGGEFIIEAAQGRQSVKLPAGALWLYHSSSR